MLDSLDPARPSTAAPLTRLSVSLPTPLFDALDAMVVERGLQSRSSAIAELIRNALAEHAQSKAVGVVLAGAITLIYRAQSGTVRHRIAQVQREFLKEVISSQHVFLEDDQSLEVLVVQGPAERLNDLCDELRSVRGVQQVRLATTTALLPPLHDADAKGQAA
jgi:CopG family transcriptional regulator, nickel-responsive regulator